MRLEDFIAYSLIAIMIFMLIVGLVLSFMEHWLFGLFILYIIGGFSYIEVKNT